MKSIKPAGQPARIAGQPDANRRRSAQAQQVHDREKPSRTPASLSAEKLARIERRKARNRAASLAMLVMLIMLVTVVAIILVMRQTRPRPRFLFIQTGEVVHQVASTGLIVRDEQVFTAPDDGTIKPLASEGSRVAKGQKLAMVIRSGKEDDLADLQKIERDIIDLQNELMNHGKGAGAQAIYDESAASLATVINLVRSDISRGTLANLNAYEASLSVILDQRTARLMKVDFDDARLTSLQQTQQALEQQLGLDSGTLVCEKPGIVSFKLDGLEDDLSILGATALTADDYRRLTKDTPPSAAVGGSVAKGSPVLRIASNLYQVLIFLLPDTDSSTFVINDVHTVNIPADGMTIDNCQVLRSVADGTGTLVVFKTDHKVEWLADRRLVQAELTVSRTSGLKVPLTSLIDLDTDSGQASLMIVTGGFTQICKVDVLDSDRESAIVQAIETERNKPVASSILVVNPESIEAGEFIGN